MTDETFLSRDWFFTEGTMHEVGLTRALIVELVAACSRAGIVRLQRAIVDIGALTTYRPEPLQHYLSLLTRDIPLLRDASIDIRIAPATLVCQACDAQEPVFASLLDACALDACAHCSSPSLRLEGGSRVTLKEIAGETRV